jgi:hypothetical protein
VGPGAQHVVEELAQRAAHGGTEVRKGTIAAFIANAKILESLAPTDPRYAEVAAQLRALTPAVRAVGVFDVLVPRTATIAAPVGEESARSG